MLNVVVPIVNNSKRYVKLLTSLSNVNGVNVFVGYVTSQKMTFYLLKATILILLSLRMALIEKK